MKTRSSHLLLRALSATVIIAACLLCPTANFAQEDKSGPPIADAPQQDQPVPGKSSQKPSDEATTKLRIRVTGDKDQPVGNASVYVRFYASGGFLRHEKLAEMNFKTNQDGSVKVPEIPQGKILVQVIAKGWHTYGKWYDIDKEEESISIKLDPPPHWY